MLYVLLIVIVALLGAMVFISVLFGSEIRRLIINASDLNLEAHGRLRDEMDNANRQLSDMPKVRQPWER